MKLHNIVLSALATLTLASACLGADAWTAQDRWFYVAMNAGNDEQVEKLSSLVERAGKAGLNAMLWSTSWDSCDRWDDAQIERLERVKKACADADIEIVPILWSVGYGTMIGKDPNLAEGLPITDLPMVVRDGEAVFEAAEIEVNNGGIEEWNGNKVAGFNFNDEPGVISFRDDEIKHSGKSSIRYENMESNKHGHGRLMYEARLQPGRVYDVSVWMKLDGLQGDVMLQVYSEDGEQSAVGRPNVDRDPNGAYTCDWVNVRTIFQAPASGVSRVYAGAWGGKNGKMWIDDLKIEPLGLVNPLRRPGTPIVVKSVDGKTVYEEGKDWVLPEFALRPWRPDSPSQKLRIPEGSKIVDGDKILVDFYYPPLVGAPQIGTCMSEPKLYELFEESAKAVKKLLDPKKWFLSMDEIRCAGTCQACRARGISLAAILGDCVTKQRDIVKSVCPDAEVYIWSDMLDPNHNAHDNYFVCHGDYTGVWDLIPKDLIISCWYYEKREESMKFFSERGFRTQAAAYYDTDDLVNCEDWFDVYKRTPGCTGIMYTTWRNKYDLMEDFGKLVSPKTK